MQALPDSRWSLMRTLAPFAGAALLAFACAPFGCALDWTEWAVAGAITLAILLAVPVVPWARLPRGATMVAALLFLVSAALLRDAAGGVTSGFTALPLLPLFWVALHARPRHLVAILGGIATYYVLPILLIGGERYPESQYRSALMFIVIGGLAGRTTQRLVTSVRTQVRESRRREESLLEIARITRESSAHRDARATIVEAARQTSGAAVAILVERDGERHLVSTASAGFDAPGLRIECADEPTSTQRVLESGHALFAADAAEDPAIDIRLWQLAGAPASMLFEPVVRGEESIGVLIVGWPQRMRPDAHAAAMIRLLAAEVAAAIERADLMSRLSELALSDSLTGLPNRRAWDGALAVGLTPDASPVCVAMLDLDHFKRYNDERGHLDGDRLLKEVAAAWRAHLRPGDVLARYGGEEFTVMLRDCDARGAAEVIERLRAATPSSQTCSAGVAEWNGAESADALMRRADDALYAAKAAGRDRLLLA